MKKIVLILLAFTLTGCMTTKWEKAHQTRLQEIQTSYDSNEITKAEYLQLKQQSIEIREQQKPSYNGMNCYTSGQYTNCY